jgi:toxin ParE1/3/4
MIGSPSDERGHKRGLKLESGPKPVPGASRTVRLVPAAQDDFDEILIYTLAQFGPEQVDRYEQRMREAFAFICTYPESRLRVAERETDLRMHTVGRHNMFFRFDERYVTITRILHVSRKIAISLIDGGQS